LGSDIPDKVSRGSQALATLVKSESAKWTPTINSANIKIECGRVNCIPGGL
jgi:hypothetical protein